MQQAANLGHLLHPSSSSSSSSRSLQPRSAGGSCPRNQTSPRRRCLLRGRLPRRRLNPHLLHLLRLHLYLRMHLRT
jgi:hypothetical protein